MSSRNPYSVRIGDWRADGAGYTDRNGVVWNLKPLDGWRSSAPRKADFTQRPQGNGAFPKRTWGKPRVIVIKGTAKAPTMRARDEAQDAATAILAEGHHGTLIVDEAHVSRQCRVYLSDETTTDPINSRTFDFSVQLTAPDPIRYSTTLRRAGVDLGAPAPSGLDFSGGGLTFPLDFGGGAADTFMYLDNPGTADTQPTFTFARPVNQPVLSNPDNGARLEYLGSVGTGQTLVIDTQAKTVLLNGVSRRTEMGRADWGGFAVPHEGVLRCALGTSSYPIAGAHVEATYRNGWW